VTTLMRRMGIEALWQSHVIDTTKENFGAFYLGINPRGLVPAPVDHGTVHDERIAREISFWNSVLQN
jgi:glutathione S-transferase